MELKDHLTAVTDPYTCFYLEKAKDCSQPSEALNYVSEAKRRITKEVKKQNEKISDQVS